MKKIYLLPLLAISLSTQSGHASSTVSNDTSADETIAATDSVTGDEPDKVTDLSEIVVEGRTQRVIKYGVEYTPDKRTKKMAMNAVSLLQLMAIPQLDITPGSLNVKMIGNRNVSIFIDYVPATEADLRGMRTQDVMRVEVLQYPEDPRFNNAEYVINYIMHKYEWGGYTNLGGDMSVINTLSGYGYLYSKFVKGKWTLDANAGGSGSRLDKFRGTTTESFRDFNFDGHHLDLLEKHSVTDGGLITHNGEWVSLRTIYSTSTAQIRHTIGFNRSAQPSDNTESHVEFSQNLLPSSHSVSDENSRRLNPYISGGYIFTLPKGNFLNLYWDFSYNSTRRNSSYRLGDLDAIRNDNHEKVYVPNASLNYSKRFSHDNTFRTSLMTYNSIYDTHYAGSYDGRQKLLSSENMLFLEYMQNWACGLNLYSRVGMSFVAGRVNGVTTIRQWNPRLGMQLRYRINQMHSASISAWWGNSHPGPAASNTAIVRSNELLWLMGNPDLRNTLFQTVNVSYDFIPTNKFSLSLYAQYVGNPHKQAYEFMVLPGYDGLVRRTINSGTAHDWTAHISGSLRLLDNTLSIKATVSGNRVVLTGVDARTLNALKGSVNINYLLGNFAFSGWWNSPSKHLGAWSMGTLASVRCHSYGLQVSYSTGDFKASIASGNWWSNGRVTSDFTSPHYSSNLWAWEASRAPKLQFQLSYTFSYGKKVSRDDQLSGGGSSSSAILK